MYAEVLLFQKTGITRETLTYEVPKDMMPVDAKQLVGALVQVPLGRSVRTGIVVAVSVAHRGEVDTTVVLRPIKNVVQTGMITPEYLAFMRWLSGEFRTPLWKIARHAMPEQIRNGKITLENEGVTEDVTEKKIPISPTRSSIVTATSRTEIIEHVHKIIDAVAKTIVILTPEIEIEPWWMMELSAMQSSASTSTSASAPVRPIVTMKGTLTPKQRALIWKRAYEEPGLIVIASRSGIYLPTRHIGAYIVMHDWAIGHKEDQEPKFHVAQIAPIVARLAGVPCTILTESPALAANGGTRRTAVSGASDARTVPAARNGDDAQAAQSPAESQSIRRRADTKLLVIDRRLERRAGKERLHDLIAQVIEKKSQMIIYLNASGEARLLRCNDCGWIPRCTRCSLTYAVESVRDAQNNTGRDAPHNATTRLACRRCHATKQPPVRCDACGNVKLRMLGTGIEQVERIIKQKFPAARTALYSGRHAPTTKERKEILKKFTIGTINILIATELLHPDSPIPEVPIVACWDIDNDLNHPHYRAAEDTLHQLQALQMHLKPRGLLLIQTHTPTHPLLTHYENNTLDQWYRDELASRKALGYPPFGEIITLMGDRMALERAYHTLTRAHRDLQIEEKTKHLKTREKPYLVIRGPRAREHAMQLPANETITIDINSPYTT